MRSINLTLFSSASWTNPILVNAFLRFLLFFVKIWLLNACFLLIFPEAVSLKRFLALDFVFCFGMFLLLIYYFAFFTLPCKQGRISSMFLSTLAKKDYIRTFRMGLNIKAAKNI